MGGPLRCESRQLTAWRRPPYLSPPGCKQRLGTKHLDDPEEVSFFLQSAEAPPRYRAVWSAYIAKRYAIAGERLVIAGMR